MLNLSTALDRSLQRSDQDLSSIGPGKKGGGAEQNRVYQQNSGKETYRRIRDGCSRMSNHLALSDIELQS